MCRGTGRGRLDDMGDAATLAWYLAEWLPPVVAGFGSGLWLLRCGRRLAGSLFLAWAVVNLLTFGVNFSYCFVGQLQPGVVADNWSRVVEWSFLLMRVVNALALTTFVVAVLRRRADES